MRSTNSKRTKEHDDNNVDFFDVEVNAEKIGNTKSSKIGIIKNCTAVNIRTEPSMDSSIITTIPVGTTVTVDGVENDFFKVIYGSINGYVSTDFIELR